MRNAQFLLRHGEDVIPQPRLVVRLHLGQVEVGAAAACEQFLGVVEEIQPEVEDPAAHLLAVHQHMLFVHVPAARTRYEHGNLVVQLVVLAVLFQGNGATDGIAQVDLPVDDVVPFRAVRILQVRHEGQRAGVKRIDDHLAIGGAGDFDATILQVPGLRADRPFGFPDGFRFRQEIGQLAGIKFLLAQSAPCQQFLAARLERALQFRHEIDRIIAQYLPELGCHATMDLDTTGKFFAHQCLQYLHGAG